MQGRNIPSLFLFLIFVFSMVYLATGWGGVLVLLLCFLLVSSLTVLVLALLQIRK